MNTTACMLALAWLCGTGSAFAASEDDDRAPRVVRELPEGVEVERLGRVQCTGYSLTSSIDENLARCEAELVRDAAAAGADYVVVETRTIGISFCNSCTRLGAGVYRVVE